MAPFDKLITILIKINSVITKINHILAFAEVMNTLYISASNAFTVLQNVVSNVERNRNSTSTGISGNSVNGGSSSVTKVVTTTAKNSSSSYSNHKINKYDNIIKLTDEEIEAMLELYAVDSDMH